MIACIGCYTSDENPEGIHVVDFRPETGELRRISTVRIPNAIYQAVSPCGRFLISCEQGGLAAFAINGDKLSMTDRIGWGGQRLCHVSVMRCGRRVCWADYLSGEAGSVGFNDGRFVPESLVRHRHEGNGPNLPRQDGAHCHQAIPLPDDSGYAVVDLGLDRISIYPQLRHCPTVPRGAGPRHLAFHPNGRFAFLASELGNLVSVYRLSEAWDFEYLSSVSTVPGDWSGESAVAAVRVSEDGSRVLVSNRGHDSIATFRFRPSSGTLEPVSVSRMPGSWPRDFVMLPGGGGLLVALERSGKVVSMAPDASGESLVQVGSLDGFSRPVSIVLL